MNDWTLGSDTSHWDGSINFETMYNSGVKFWITKATDANKTTGYQFEDSRFDGYMRAAVAQGEILKGCYHWLQASVDPVEAADFYLERYFRFDMDFPPVMDFEEISVRTTGKYSDYAWRAQEWCNRVKEQTRRKPLIYTAKWYTDYFPNHLLRWMGEYPLWVATYPYVMTPFSRPYMPSPWTDWTIWQYTDKGDGRKYGVQARAVDLNYFKGTYNDLLAFLDKEPVTPPAPPPTIFEGKVINANILTIRTGPSINYPATGYLNRGDKVEVTEIGGKDAWVKHERGWSAMKVGDKTYIAPNE